MFGDVVISGVQTSRDFARNIGVQWGINGRASSALGNTLPLAFPNQGSITGRTGAEVNGADGVSNMVNLGVDGIAVAPQNFRGTRVAVQSAVQAGIPVVWEISSGRMLEDHEPEYLTLDVLHDGTFDLTRRGVVRLALPGEDDIGALPNDVRQDPDAGSRARPPLTPCRKSSNAVSSSTRTRSRMCGRGSSAASRARPGTTCACARPRTYASTVTR